MSIIERVDHNMSDKRIKTRLALVEQSQVYTHQTLERIERKLEALDKKIDRIENRIYANLKWIIGLSIPTLLSVAGLSIEVYQYIKVK